MGDGRALCPECDGPQHDGPCRQRPLPGRCSRWTGIGYCGAKDGTRQYVAGYRCPDHTPAALAGQPEPPTDTPGIPLYRRLAAVQPGTDPQTNTRTSSKDPTCASSTAAA